jgi:hypothetical protein
MAERIPPVGGVAEKKTVVGTGLVRKSFDLDCKDLEASRRHVLSSRSCKLEIKNVRYAAYAAAVRLSSGE